MFDLISSEAMASFFKVVLIDIALAGDNAIVIAMAAASLPAVQRKKAILLGIIAAAVLRIIFAIGAVQLLNVVGLSLAGGLLLLWVCWKLWRELRHGGGDDLPDATTDEKTSKNLRQAVLQIVLADISMSLDNVLAVAGAAREHPGVLVFGLALSVGLMAVAATLIANLLQRFRWIAYLGLLIILYVSLEMIFHGGTEAWHATAALL